MTEAHKETERIEGNIRRACAFAVQYAPGAQDDLNTLLSANAGTKEALEQAEGALILIRNGTASALSWAEANTGVPAQDEALDTLLLALKTARDVALSALPTGAAGDLHPDTSVALAAFMEALRAKLRKAELKYGYSNGWKTEDWEAQCKAHLLEHLHKGDPLDVAAYAMFCHQRGWSTSPTGEAVTVDDPNKLLGLWLSWSHGHGFKVTEAATIQALAGLQQKTRAQLNAEAQPLPPVEEGVPSGSGDLARAFFDGERVGEPDGMGGTRDQTCPDWFPAVTETIHIANIHAIPQGRVLVSGYGLHIGATPETLTARPGDWIVRNQDGSFAVEPGEAPSPSKERVEKLEAALKELGEASRGSHLAYPSAGEYAEAETRLSRALESADALLPDTELE